MHMNRRPASEKLVTPTHPAAATELEADSTAARSVSYSAPALQTDRLLERLGPRRLAEIRARLSSGAYGSPEVMKELAIRLLESGALA